MLWFNRKVYQNINDALNNLSVNWNKKKFEELIGAQSMI